MEIVKLWFDNNRIYVKTAAGETLYQSLLFYPRLMRARPRSGLIANCGKTVYTGSRLMRTSVLKAFIILKPKNLLRVCKQCSSQTQS